jgi:NTP pyrophosphatase (non-canonical NTP hydrolase)
VDLAEFQRLASVTDQYPGESDSDRFGLGRHEVIPMLGLVGEVGGLLGEYKKLLRDGSTHRKFRDEVSEELGDILWYVANVATKFGLDLGQIAEENLAKVRDRWLAPGQDRSLYDDDQSEARQLPRKFEYLFEHRVINSMTKIVLVDRLGGGATGDPLTDNAYDDDGYRYHDALHLAFAACLGWSPILRKLLRVQGVVEHREPPQVDEVEDGGRAQVIEEAIVAAAYVYAADHDFLNGVAAVDWQLLRHIKQLTANVEVSNRTTWEWNATLLVGFAVWRKLRENGGGVVRGDLRTGTFEFAGMA